MASALTQITRGPGLALLRPGPLVYIAVDGCPTADFFGGDLVSLTRLPNLDRLTRGQRDSLNIDTEL